MHPRAGIRIALTSRIVGHKVSGLYEGSTSSDVQTEAGMSRSIVRTTVGIPISAHAKIDELSRSRGVPRATVIRDAIADYLSRPNEVTANLARIAMTSEFTQAAVDILIRQQAPEKRDEILLTVEQRMERFHGPK